MIKSFNFQTLAVTGANSYVGLNFIKFCLDCKINVRAFCKNPDVLPLNFIKSNYLEAFSYSLDATSDLNFKNVDAIIHLAHERIYGARMNFRRDLNFLGAKHLIQQAKYHEIKNIIYLSSHLAHQTTLSQYGKSKFNCEKLFIDNGYIAVRAGMVFGGQPHGFYKLLLEKLKSNKIIPIICASAPIYPIHIEDLTKALLALIKLDHKNKQLYCLGEKRSTKLKLFFCHLAFKYYNKKIICISFPATIIYLLTYVVSYFNGFFNKIFERVAGALSLVAISTEESIDYNDGQNLRKTKIFFQG